MSWPPVLIGLLAGALLGGGYFALLHHAVHQFEAAGVGHMLGMTVLRAALAAAVFWGLVQLGAAALLAGLGGFLLARYVARRLVGG